MRVSGVVALLSMAGASFAQQSVTGIWSASLVNPPTGKDAAQLKMFVARSSMKLNKNKTFGMQLLKNVMLGTWTLNGNKLTLNVKEVYGKSKKEVAALPVSDRTANLILKGGKLYLTPPSGKNPLVWKKRA